jgi:hypothetical protein
MTALGQPPSSLNLWPTQRQGLPEGAASRFGNCSAPSHAILYFSLGSNVQTYSGRRRSEPDAFDMGRGNRAANATTGSKTTSALQHSARSSPNGPSLTAPPDSEDNLLLMKEGLKPISEVPRSQAQPIVRTTTDIAPYQIILSPRTTRRNMLASELTVSLRQHLLWERKQKSQTANAVLKRRHTAHDVANLKQFPGKVYMDGENAKSSWNDY